MQRGGKNHDKRNKKTKLFVFCLGLSLTFAVAAWAGKPQVLRIPIDEEPDSFNVAGVPHLREGPVHQERG